MNLSSNHYFRSWRLLAAAISIIVVLGTFSSHPTSFAQRGTPAATMAATSSCASVTDSADSIKIGASIPITGRYAAGGVQIQNGYQLAVADINGAGGVVVNCQRMKLELTILDDAS